MGVTPTTAVMGLCHRREWVQEEARKELHTVLFPKPATWFRGGRIGHRANPQSTCKLRPCHTYIVKVARRYIRIASSSEYHMILAPPFMPAACGGVARSKACVAFVVIGIVIVVVIVVATYHLAQQNRLACGYSRVSLCVPLYMVRPGSSSLNRGVVLLISMNTRCGLGYTCVPGRESDRENRRSWMCAQQVEASGLGGRGEPPG